MKKDQGIYINSHPYITFSVLLGIQTIQLSCSIHASYKQTTNICRAINEARSAFSSNVFIVERQDGMQSSDQWPTLLLKVKLTLCLLGEMVEREKSAIYKARSLKV